MEGKYMGKIRIDQYVVGPVQTNCYFAVNTETKEALIIDPGDSSRKLSEKIRQEELTPVAILLTHGHFDHAGAARELAEEFHISIYAHEAEQEVLEDPQKNSSWMIGERRTFSADVFLQSEQELDLAGFHIRVLHTPGHTVGGCCYYLPYEDVVFSGDTLFCTSVGRTDLPTGSMSQLVRSVREKLMSLPDATTVYPGHGELTTIETERMYNPYL
jgi:glyoxylase-like metal-dependent hydrolase (beta-lactamase superfamily II)